MSNISFVSAERLNQVINEPGVMCNEPGVRRLNQPIDEYEKDVYRTVIGTTKGDMKILDFGFDAGTYKVECCKCKKIYQLHYSILNDRRCNLHMFACVTSNKLK